eukprot:GFYU01013550.1.p1 GENE.GFYU01013550.1~~GFYU01013550.1.p1  ORF type:complete len:324 (-),score=106.51 GFYU01013550.1:260-1231(-)
MTKRIVVTGGAGFIGSNICRRLVNEGHHVICVDNFQSSRKENIEELLKLDNFEFIEHDIINSLEGKVTGINQIYNLACAASPPVYQKDPIHTLETCFIGMSNMLKLARANNATILQASTSEVYGDPLVHPQPESYRGNVNPIGIRACYDEGKRITETLMFDYHRAYNVDIRVARIFNTYGPWMHPYDGRVVSNFIRQVLMGEDLTIYGTGSQTRSFQYIDDLVEGLYRLMNNDKGFHGPCNLGNPNEFTIKELADLVIEKMPGSTKLIHKELPSDDPTQRKPVIETAAAQLNGWEPKIQLKEGLDKTIAYFSGLNMSDYKPFV